MKEVFSVNNLDPKTEINHVIGTKSALAMLPAAFINPGDITLMPTPSYPILGTHTEYYGGKVVHLPLLEENGFLPRLDTLGETVLQRAKLLYLNYPNNPIGASANVEFFSEVVKFAKKHELIVVHDAAYAALVFDGEKPLSFLSVPGAKEVGIELHSLSKSFNMTGWRIGFIAGNSKLIKAFATVKDNNDSGQFIAIQKAASFALSHPEITEHISEKYSRRHEQLVKALYECGFHAKKPKGSFFLYTKIPKSVVGGQKFESAEEFSQYLIREHLISTVPWDVTGGNYVRFSVTFVANGMEEEQRVIEEIKARLKTAKFVFEKEVGLVQFTKMHGLGNSYVFFNLLEDSMENTDFAQLSKQVSNVNFGIGSDGIILMGLSDRADFRMRIFNEDGSEAKNCGNGLRCVSKYLYDHMYATSPTFTIETLGGDVRVEVEVDKKRVVNHVVVDMGEPKLLKMMIPMFGRTVIYHHKRTCYNW